MGMYLMRRAIGDGCPRLCRFSRGANCLVLWWGTQHFARALVLIVTSRPVGAGLRWFVSARRSGVYFLHHDRALTYAGMLLFFRNETGFGGNNGFTGFTTLLVFRHGDYHADRAFPLTVMLLLAAAGTGYALAKSKFGRI